jgi:thioredoxin 1
MDCLADRFRDKVSILRVNLEQIRGVALRLGIKSIPTLIVFENGDEIQRFVGLQAEGELTSALETFLKK